ncbi:MAG: SGNH/GDSL hydrolase family protein [Armatimonadetes bacterium]|nr:SGNH/GDSL hydrolase family protein [Armatimonadota bacterium]
MRSMLLVVLSVSLSSLFRCAAAPLLATDARLAIAGDSITEQKLYSKFMETYLLACAGRRDLHVFQYGWGGETAGGFAGRLENDLADFKPTVVTLCYGMNDGGYRPFDDNVGAGYSGNMRAILGKVTAMGITSVVVGSPGAVDTKFFANRPSFGNASAAAGYNDSLRHLRDLDEKLATEFKQAFADVHSPLVEAMAKAKAALGEEYDVCGRDGVHPGPNGQLVMAYAFLKALGCDGNIGEITVDMKGGATATEGHKVLSASLGKVELESTRYPFCFDPDPKASGSTRSILPFLPFNQDLNRLVLKVKNLEAPKAKVTWGDESKEFARDQLEAGINLASEFTKTPFDSQFKKVLQVVGAKQAFETGMIKSMVTHFRWLNQEFTNDPDMLESVRSVRQKLTSRHDKWNEDVHAAVVPVKHTVTIVAEP